MKYTRIPLLTLWMMWNRASDAICLAILFHLQRFVYLWALLYGFGFSSGSISYEFCPGSEFLIFSNFAGSFLLSFFQSSLLVLFPSETYRFWLDLWCLACDEIYSGFPPDIMSNDKLSFWCGTFTNFNYDVSFYFLSGFSSTCF